MTHLEYTSSICSESRAYAGFGCGWRNKFLILLVVLLHVSLCRLCLREDVKDAESNSGGAAYPFEVCAGSLLRGLGDSVKMKGVGDARGRDELLGGESIRASVGKAKLRERQPQKPRGGMSSGISI